MFRILILAVISFCFSSYAKNIASFHKKGAKNVKNIPFKEVQLAYQVISQNSLNTPTPKTFVNDYIRYRIAVEEAYNDKTLVQSAKIKNMIVHAGLKESFDQLLYKTLAEKKMQPRLVKIDREVKSLTTAQMKNFYKKNPYYSLQYIVVTLPESPSSVQLKQVQNRASTIYQKVSKSKKPFGQLVAIHSDNPSVGTGAVFHSRSTLYPLLYKTLQALKPGQISQPVQTPNGFYILRLGEVLDFSKANKDDIKRQYFSQKRSEVLNNYFNKVQSAYNISIDQKALQAL